MLKDLLGINATVTDEGGMSYRSGLLDGCFATGTVLPYGYKITPYTARMEALVLLYFPFHSKDSLSATASVHYDCTRGKSRNLRLLCRC